MPTLVILVCAAVPNVPVIAPVTSSVPVTTVLSVLKFPYALMVTSPVSVPVLFVFDIKANSSAL